MTTDRNNDEKQITWFQFNNIVPIVSSAVMITLSWAALNTKIALIDQKLDTYIANQNTIIKELAEGRKINATEIALIKTDVNTLKIEFKNLKIGDHE